MLPKSARPIDNLNLRIMLAILQSYDSSVLQYFILAILQPRSISVPIRSDEELTLEKSA